MNILLYSGKYEGYQMLRRLIDLKKSPAYLFILKGSSPWEAEIDKKAPVYVGRIPGAVVEIGQSRVVVLTGDGVYRIGLVQLEGEEARPAAEVLDSLNIRLGEKNAG